VKTYKVVFGLMMVFLLQYGCAAPAFTHCTGSISIQVDQTKERQLAEETGNRFIVVSFWDYPTVNETKGELILDKVFATESSHITIEFPLRIYWVVWTPALGTQHLAPRPGIIVFHEDYLACWEIGNTTTGRICCGRPTTKHEFIITPTTEGVASGQDAPFPYLTREFLEEFLAKKDDLISRMNSGKKLSTNESSMVLNKLDQITAMHGIRCPE
jgi:hypothetical protein